MRIELRENILIILVLLAATFICYSSVLDAGFIWDDEYLIKGNALLRSPVWSFHIFKQDITGSNFTYTIYYRPIQILSYALDYRVWGMDAFGFHLFSVFLHFLNGLVVFFLIRKLFRENVPAFLAALFFLINPLQAGAVSYISSRADLLFFFFGFLSMFLFAVFKERKSPVFIIASLVSLAASFLSKEAAVIFPFLILFLDIVVLGKKFSFKAVHHVPNFALTGVYFFLHHLFFGARYPVLFGSADPLRIPARYLLMAGRFFTAGILPLDPQIRFAAGRDVLQPAYLVPAVILILLSVILLKRDRRILLFSLGFFMIALMPLASVAGYFDVFASHWMYPASFGLFLFLAASIRGLCGLAGRSGNFLFAALVFAAVFFFAEKTEEENMYWKDDIVLSDRVLHSSIGDEPASYFKAASRLKSGLSSRSSGILDEFIKQDTRDPKTCYTRGRLLLAAGDTHKAEKYFKKAAGLDPGYDSAYLGLALVEFRKERGSSGIELLKRALEINPGYPEAHHLLTKAYLQSGDGKKALEAAKRAKMADPYGYDSIMDLARAYMRQGNLRKAAGLCLEASRLYPESAEPYYELGYMFYLSGRKKESRDWLERAIMTDPDFSLPRELLKKLRR